MTVQELVNLGACGAGNALGSNLSGGCIQQLAAASAYWMIAPNFAFDPSADFNLAYVQTEIANGNIIPLRGINTFTETGSDDAVETLEDDTQNVTNEGKYMFEATFLKGLFNNRVLHSLKGYGSYKLAFVDKAGNIFLTQNVSGAPVGFNLGMIQPMKLTFPSNTVTMKEGLKVQLLDRYEVDENYVFIERGNLDFDPRLVDGVTEVTLSFVNAPANSDVAVRVKAVRAQDQKSEIADLEFGDLLFQVAGATVAFTGGTPVAGISTQADYAFTPALNTSQAVTLQIYDSGNNRAIINKNGNLYKSAAITATVT